MKKKIVGTLFIISIILTLALIEKVRKPKTEVEILKERIEEARLRVPEDVIDFKDAALNLYETYNNNKKEIYIGDSLKKELNFNYNFIKEDEYGIRYFINKINDQYILFSIRGNNYEKIENKKMMNLYFFIVELKKNKIVISGKTFLEHEKNYINFKDGNLYFIENTKITKNESDLNIIFDQGKVRNTPRTGWSTLRTVENYLDKKQIRYDNFKKKEMKFRDGVYGYLYSNNLYGNNDDYLDVEITAPVYYVDEDEDDRLKWFGNEKFQTHVIYKNNKLNIQQKKYYIDNYNPRLFSEFNILSDQKDDFGIVSGIYGMVYIVNNKVVLYTRPLSGSYAKHIKVGCDLYISVIEKTKKKIDLYSINLCESKQIDE